MTEEPPRFDAEGQDEGLTQRIPQTPPPAPGGENEITGYQPVVPPASNQMPASNQPPAPPASNQPPAPPTPPPPVKPPAPLPPLGGGSSGRPSTPIRNNPLPPEPEEVIEVSAAPLLLAIGAFLVAIVALLIAMGILNLGQNSQLISSDRLANGSVGEAQISSESITLGKLSPGLVEELRGREGPAGPAGARGRRGATGPGLEGLKLISRSVSGTQSASVTASCGAGQIALSGGASISTPSGKVILTASEPSGDEAGWLARAVAIAPKPGTWSLSSFAWCADDPR